MGLKRQKILEIFFHRFSDSKLPQKMVLVVFTRCLVPEIRIFGHCWLKSTFWGQISAEPTFLQLNQWMQVVYNIILDILLKNQENPQSRFFAKTKKLKNADFSKISNFQEKSGSVTFEPLSVPNSMPICGEILRAVFEKIHSGHTYDKGDFISPFGFQPVTKKDGKSKRSNNKVRLLSKIYLKMKNHRSPDLKDLNFKYF